MGDDHFAIAKKGKREKKQRMRIKTREREEKWVSQ